ncbi:MAG: alpha/beta hydrolase [Bacteroidales bacterium]|nr:alpha/beta hydrolase [Candidatus Cacconaster caballi]
MNCKRLLILSVLLLSFSAGECPAADFVKKKCTARIDTVILRSADATGHSAAVMYCFVPEDPGGVAAIICPGGSYCWLDMKNEGFAVAEWLNEQGISAFVLHYRTAGFGAWFWHSRYFVRGIRHPDMIADVQRALQWVGGFSEKYGADCDKIGVIGFSAGGHLAMSAACFSDTPFLEREGLSSNVNVKPAFVASIYPVVTLREPFVHKRSRRALLGDDRQRNKMMIDSLSLELHIPDDCPPVFLVNCRDDKVVDYHNSVMLDSALTAAGARHLYRQYESGGHGFGVSESRGSAESRKWKWEFIEWLKEIDIVK